MERSFEDQIRELVEDAGVGRRVLFKVLTRVVRSSPRAIARVEIARGRGSSDGFGRLSEGSVSRAVASLTKNGLLEEVEINEPGSRSSSGVRLSRSNYRCIGIHVHSSGGRPIGLTGVVTGLGGNLLATHCIGLASAIHEQNLEVQELLTAARVLVEQLMWLVPDRDTGSVLGVGVEIGGHVHAGNVINSTNENWSRVDLANMLETELKMPVVLENDVNALAIWETHRHRYQEANMAVVALFDDGVGAALILDGKVFRGGRGMAGEIGHLAVGTETDLPIKRARRVDKGDRPLTFSDPCLPPCREVGHLDCLVTPSRICGELGVRDFEAIALSPAIDARTEIPTPEHEVFEKAGRALGQGLAALINIVNPSRILLLLPDALISPPRRSTAASYMSALENSIDKAFSTGATDARARGRTLESAALTSIRDLSDAGIDATDADPIDVILARAACATVTDAFLAQLAGKTRPRATTV